LKFGANSVIGPEIDLPAPFAANYVKELFSAFLKGGVRLGDAMRDLTRACATRQNPLGLIFALYRGLDTKITTER